MVEDIRSSLNYNYKITAQKFRDTGINAENIIREIRDRGLNIVELEPGFIRKSWQIFDIYNEAIKKGK